MNDEIETVIHTDDGVRVSVSKWDDGGAWLHLSMSHGDMRAVFTRSEAQKLLSGLQEILAKGVNP